MHNITVTKTIPYLHLEYRQRLQPPLLFTCLPGMSAVQRTGAHLTGKQVFVFPLIGERWHCCCCHLQEINETATTLKAKGWITGELLSLTLNWILMQQAGGVQVTFHGEYTIAETVCTEIVDALRGQGPLPIRSDADAILSQAVNRLLTETLEQYSEAYVANVCTWWENPGRGEGSIA